MVASADTTKKNTGRALAVRLIMTAVGIGVWFGTQALISKRPLPSSGIGDGMHLLTAPLNQYFLQHATAANGLLIVSSSLIDLLAIFVLARWVFGASVRPFLGLLILLGLRQLMQALCALPMPPNMIWHYPGVPTLLVTYSVANDYYFSGHTAIAVFAATELARLGGRWLTMLGVVLAIFEATTVLILRAHYTMDVFTGTIVALYVAYLVERISPPIDRWLARYLAPAS